MLATSSPYRGDWSGVVARQQELTAESLWTEVSGRLQEALNDTTFGTWFGDVSSHELTDETFVLSVPNDFTREWIEGHFLDLIGAAVRDATGADRQIRLSVEQHEVESAGPIPEPETPGQDRIRHEPEVHVRLVRDRLVEPLRARGRAGRSGGSGPGVQPALHLRRNRPREDAPPAGDRPVRRRAFAQALRSLHHERDVHERLHQLAARQAHRGVQAALPDLRPSSDRRHSVPRAQGANPGGVLPHVQLALRGGPADRHLLRPAAARDLDPRGAAPLAIRVGPRSRISSRPTSRRASRFSARR